MFMLEIVSFKVACGHRILTEFLNSEDRRTKEQTSEVRGQSCSDPRLERKERERRTVRVHA